MLRLSGKTIVITGAGSGIGRGLALGLAAEGANISVVDLNPQAAHSVSAEIASAGGDAIGLAADVTDRTAVSAAIAQTVERFGSLDVFFNNAGMNSPMQFLDVTEENFSLIMNVNVLGVLIGTQEAAKQFISQGNGGKIVNTASIAGRTGFPSFAPYSAAKAAVISLTQAGARALATHGITVNAFAPGVVDTPLWEKLDKELEEIGESDSRMENLSSGILIGRPATPDDIVPTGVFLASSDSDYVTGQVIPIEGGMILV
jgi:meso-butanediol dehydrogenase/(S,S)-butanediol dehydrogenase/diacetyl reductase